ALAGELPRKRGKVDREIAVRLPMLDDDDAGQHARRIDADEDLDRTVIGALERLELRRPEREPQERRRGIVRRGSAIYLEVRRIAVLRREARGIGKSPLDQRTQRRIVVRLTVHGGRRGET